MQEQLLRLDRDYAVDVFARKAKYEALWTFSAGGSTRVIECVFDGAADTVAIKVDHLIVATVLPSDAWKAGQNLRLDVGGAKVQVSVRYGNAPLNWLPEDQPIFRVSVDGRNISSQDVRERGILWAMISLPVPLLIAVAAAVALPQASTLPALIVGGAAGLAWALGFPWWARRRLLDGTVFGWYGYQPTAISVFLLPLGILVVEIVALAVIGRLGL